MNPFNGWLLCNGSPLPPDPPYKMANIVECAEGVTTVSYAMFEGDERGSHIVCRYITPTLIETVVKETTRDGDKYPTFRDAGYRRVYYGETEFGS